MRRIYAIMLGAFIVAGCLPYDIDEILLAREDISITQKGTLIMNYDPLKCQMSHDKATNTYMIYDDMIANWFIVSCSTRPDTEGQEITADVTWTTDKNTKTERGLVFTVKKIDSQGQIWMWNKSKSIGIVIKNL
jgi:hypothetical protein